MTEIADFAAVLLLVTGAVALAVMATMLTGRIPVPAPAVFLIAAAVVSDIWPQVYEVVPNRRALGHDARSSATSLAHGSGFLAVFVAGLVLGDARLGYDAIRKTAKGPQLLQIKGRCILPGSNPSQRVGGINLDKEWDAVLLVLLDDHLDATAMYEAERPAVEAV